ncbi:unnamed protein product [Rodentolepis nana]|uniref:BTB domain-containing protein n=1 Tax=Rodentolepis nana TaxID=102285 RepID=A0A0R3T7V2_RODNA|nr:unnamed protein product [Rodentolepis nana]
MASKVIGQQRSKSDCLFGDIYYTSSIPNHSHFNNAYLNGPISNVELPFHGVAATSVNTTSSEFMCHLIQVLYTGLPPPDPMILEALTHNPHFFLSLWPNSASVVGFDPPGLSNDERRKPHSRRISSTVMRIFSPMRKKSRRLRKLSHQQTRTRSFRPSTTSLPAQIMMPMSGDVGTRHDYWWSMLQLARDITNPPVPFQTSQPTRGSPAIVSISDESKRTKDTLDTSPAMTETADNTSLASDGVSLNQEIASVPSQSSPVPTLSTPDALTDEAQIAKLKQNAQRIEAAIRNIESRKSSE